MDGDDDDDNGDADTNAPDGRGYSGRDEGDDPETKHLPITVRRIFNALYYPICGPEAHRKIVGDIGNRSASKLLRWTCVDNMDW